jgi:glutaconate CoA-transferase, subunit A
MNLKQNKKMELKEAISLYVKTGCHISIGGFTINRNPMAAVYEIIRQKIDKLHIYAHSNGQGVDELVGAGCVHSIEIAYAGSGKFASTCIRFKKAVQENLIRVEDYTNYQMTLRFLAGAMGLPFLPTKSSFGTDIINKWGFSKKIREASDRLPNDKIKIIDNPFGDWGNAEKLVLVPGINPDVTIIHVQKADLRGNCQIQGLSFADVEQAKAAEHLIITCEELYDNDTLKNDPDRTQIPFIHADAVVHAPYGAYPTACYNFYDYDSRFLKDYTEIAKDDSTYKAYLEKFIYGVNDYKELLQLVGETRLKSIKADPKTGYASGLGRI